MKLKQEMYNLKRNNYNLKPKNSTIYTPSAVSQFIYELLKDKLNPLHELIHDPCSGWGSLLEPWKKTGHRTWGNDINSQLLEQGLTDTNYDYLKMRIDWTRKEAEYPKLVLCNPPFNGYGKQLGSEVWLDKIIELFGKEVPIVLFAPVGFCLNLTLESKRHEKFENGTYPPISSRITLPKNIFEGVIFHSEQSPDSFSVKGLEILIFNIKGLKGHYFYKPYEPTI